MSLTFHYSDHAKWNATRGNSVGRVAKRLAKTTYVRRDNVAATPLKPQYRLMGVRSGKLAAHRLGLSKKRG
jgi:hypothetical protein